MGTAAALYFGHATSNIGDIALNSGVEQLLSLSGVRLDAVVLPPAGRAFALRGKEEFASQPSFIEMSLDSMTLEVLDEYCHHPERLFQHYGLGEIDTVLIHSGEHFYAPKTVVDLHPLALWRLLPILAGKATGRKVILLPSTFGPFENRRVGRILRDSLSIADAIAAREPASQRALMTHVGRDLPTLLDPAFFLTGPEGRAPSGSTLSLAVAMRMEGVGLRAGAERSSALVDRAQAVDFRESIAFQFTSRLIERLAKEVGSLTVTLFTQALSDAQLHESLLHRIAQSEGSPRITVVRAFEGSVERYQDALAQHNVILSSRFHGCVLGLARGVPAIGVQLASHGHKMTGLFELIGAGNFVVVPETLDSLDTLVENAIRSIQLSTEGYTDVWPRIDHMRLETTDWLKNAMVAPPTDQRRQARAALTRLRKLLRGMRSARHD